MLGTLASFVHGSAFPVAMFIFGDITNAFINREVTDSLNATVDCNAVFDYMLPDSNITLFNATLQDVLALTVGGDVRCLTDDLFRAEINRLVFIFIGIAVGAFLFGMVQTWFFRLTAERQVFKIRLQYYRAVLRQELAWFDLNPTGSISDHLSRYDKLLSPRQAHNPVNR